MKIIDFHAHPFLDASQRVTFYPIDDPDTPAFTKQKVLDSGISHICSSVIKADGSFNMRELNDAALKLRDIFGADFYTPGFHIHPGQVEESIAEIERMHKEGVHLIGELVPYMHGWQQFDVWPCIDELNTMLDVAQKYNMVLSYHILWHWPIEPVIAAHPNMPFVAAHPGGKEDVDKHIERMRKYDNAYLDLSGTGIMRYGCLRRLVNEVGADRLLFGTDYPLRQQALYVQAVMTEGLKETDLEKIFHGNAERLLKL